MTERLNWTELNWSLPLIYRASFVLGRFEMFLNSYMYVCVHMWNYQLSHETTFTWSYGFISCKEETVFWWNFSSASFKIQGSVRKFGLSVNIIQFLFDIRCFVPRFAESPPNSPLNSKRHLLQSLFQVKNGRKEPKVTQVCHEKPKILPSASYEIFPNENIWQNTVPFFQVFIDGPSVIFQMEYYLSNGTKPS